MTPEAQRKVILGLMGFHPFVVVEDEIKSWKHAPTDSVWVDYTVPDPTKDLNAMHQAEKLLTFEQYADFASFLCTKSGGWNKEVISASAAIRAKAFLRTLNLWDDSV
jgi:hypothetical protein